MGDIVIELIPQPTEDVRTLIDELNEELSGLYTDEQRHGFSVDRLFQPHIRFFVARTDGKPAGCGGVAFFPGFGEVKRMYVRRALRGKGIADAIMARLVAETALAGLSNLKLETGAHSLEAIRFYERFGFKHCEAFEPYSSMPRHTIVKSIFMERRV